MGLHPMMAQMLLARVVIFGIAVIGTSALALTPDQIALVVNSSEPQSLQLAEFYREARSIPEDRIIELKLPTGEELTQAEYDRDVLGPVRTFLLARGLDTQVKCLVTFYGVPLRIAGDGAKGNIQQDATAALDSELAMLWYAMGSRAGPLHNPLHASRYEAPSTQSARSALMVTRLDGPTPQSVRDIIAASLGVERDGLRGKVVVDAGGSRQLDPTGKKGGYTPTDDALKQLAEIVRSKTTLELVFDDKAELLPPDSADDVALYCGWYSVRKYVPTNTFARGAVGFHIASYELVSLRGKQEQGWVKGMLTDGATATLGAVAEPYLLAFPPPDTFFPLLMTGKLTLAEVYWRTTPLTSWMITVIGDPLYTPFKTNPALKPDDLPQSLRGLVEARESR